MSERFARHMKLAENVMHFARVLRGAGQGESQREKEQAAHRAWRSKKRSAAADLD